MCLRFLLASVSLILLAGCVQGPAAPSARPAGFQVDGTALIDATGAPFVMRGINQPHAWQRDRTFTVLPQIADTGANMVRVSLSSGDPWGKTPVAEVARIIDTAKANQLVVMLTVHNTTGFGQQDWAVSQPDTIPYWLSLREVLAGQEAYVLINPGNEPTGNTLSGEAWKGQTIETLQALRRAGFTHTLVFDAHGWGQDGDGAMRAMAPEIFAADPLANTMFSVHMYQVYDTPAEIEDYFAAFRAMDLALIVGEFGMDHQGEPVDEETIFRAAARHEIGYIGWSWSGNSAAVADLDITVDFDPARLSPWGERLIHGAGGIAQTARPAGVFERESRAAPFHFHKLRHHR